MAVGSGHRYDALDEEGLAADPARLVPSSSGVNALFCNSMIIKGASRGNELP
jgi:hypothetical protein